MIRIKNLQEVRAIPEGPVKRAMLARAELCHYGDEEVMAEMEEEFNGVLGGDWNIFEEGDDPHNFEFDVGYTTQPANA